MKNLGITLKGKLVHYSENLIGEARKAVIRLDISDTIYGVDSCE